MRITKDDIEIKMEIPGAVIRQQTGFGDATGLGKISGEYFSLSAGVDTTPLFLGLDGKPSEYLPAVREELSAAGISRSHAGASDNETNLSWRCLSAIFANDFAVFSQESHPCCVSDL